MAKQTIINDNINIYTWRWVIPSHCNFDDDDDGITHHFVVYYFAGQVLTFCLLWWYCIGLLMILVHCVNHIDINFQTTGRWWWLWWRDVTWRAVTTVTTSAEAVEKPSSDSLLYTATPLFPLWLCSDQTSRRGKLRRQWCVSKWAKGSQWLCNCIMAYNSSTILMCVINEWW